ncbi:hypothetical protein GRI89_12820 [Altererythrobacter salegens]|uniref:Uncharacterized protein n=1 Tax=Croceibacterium salegens TaxID=1737568 RepID=A0A6I4SYZ7_9SPHN|nr:hypothetical protein [Croceibacterium salegens]MXO60420.1 hypothetical protein [Croceibacterium salegens]
MKPESIRKFDMFYLGSLAISVVSIIVGYDALVAEVAAEGEASGMALGQVWAIGAVVIGLAISLLLWWLTSSKRLSIAKWIIVLFFVLGLIGLPGTLADGLTMLEIIGLVSVAAQATAIWYLFRPDAKEWFAGSSPVDPKTFD